MFNSFNFYDSNFNKKFYAVVIVKKLFYYFLKQMKSNFPFTKIPINNKSSGEYLFEKATHKKKTWLPWNTERNNDNAAELFIKSGNCYNYEKQYDKASDAFKSAAQCYEHNESYSDAGMYYEMSAECLKYIHGIDNNNETIQMYHMAIDMYQKCVDVIKIAKIYRKLFSYFEHDYNFELAMEYLSNAIDYYQSDSMYNTTTFTLKMNMGDLCIKTKQYDYAITWYESVLEYLDQNNSFKYKIIEALFMASACHILIGIKDVSQEEKISQEIEKYKSNYIIFNHSRESEMINSILQALPRRLEDSLENIYNKYVSLFDQNVLRQQLFYEIKQNWPIIQPDENFQ